MRLNAGRTNFTHLCAIHNCILQSRPEAATDVISGRFVRLAVPEKCVKFRDPRLNCSPGIQPKAVGGGTFERFLNFHKCRPEVAGDVISRRSVESAGMDVRAKFDDSRLNNGRIMRLLGRPYPFYALLYSIYLYFAVDQKQLVIL